MRHTTTTRVCPLFLAVVSAASKLKDHLLPRLKSELHYLLMSSRIWRTHICIRWDASSSNYPIIHQLEFFRYFFSNSDLIFENLTLNFAWPKFFMFFGPIQKVLGYFQTIVKVVIWAYKNVISWCLKSYSWERILIWLLSGVPGNCAKNNALHSWGSRCEPQKANSWVWASAAALEVKTNEKRGGVMTITIITRRNASNFQAQVTQDWDHTKNF